MVEAAGSLCLRRRADFSGRVDEALTDLVPIPEQFTPHVGRLGPPRFCRQLDLDGDVRLYPLFVRVSLEPHKQPPTSVLIVIQTV